MRRGLIFFWRVVGLVLLVGAVSASAYAVGHATRKDQRDLEAALAAADDQTSRPQSASAERRDGTRSDKARTRRKGSRRSADRASRQAVARGTVAVAVLNATEVAGLASIASDKLATAGFGRGLVSNDERERRTTAVLFARGDRRGALEVAKVLGVKRRAVRPMDATTRALVGTDTRVVVTIGSDWAPS